ncbi:uncharacterized protein LOC105433261 [Pogonomyrmex barbatus]|uniref:Uncharacterized protein LOC105433261 n=1 Tax=Pogonomyrmex barbatus TaxID=144034 RepID=A0A6I9WS61_9HYME|nr:uncharacterized protein LOC105433261 [Pogonomyrmex barbatus]
MCVIHTTPVRPTVPRLSRSSPWVFAETHIHGNTQCHSVELLPVEKEQKLVYKRPCHTYDRTSCTTINNHRFRSSDSSACCQKLKKFGASHEKRVATLSMEHRGVPRGQQEQQ